MESGTHKERSDMVAIGKVLGVHGLRGDVRVQSYSDVPGRFEGLRKVTMLNPRTGARTLVVQGVRSTPSGYLVNFEGIDTPEAAASLVGAILQIPQQPLAPLSDDRYYECDLLGMEVRTEEGLVVGALTDILSTTSNAIFVVRGAEGSEHLIPATKEIVRTIDVPHRMMTVRQMAGLLDEGAADAV
ncbi:MAG: 16S rRNA processing protein RimM [Nitrospirae bacterium]|nr:MAG: 16S rRNA processing protein RimM [Nitrospirota bacterium]